MAPLSGIGLVHFHFLVIGCIANLFNCKFNSPNFKDVSLLNLVVLFKIWLVASNLQFSHCCT